METIVTITREQSSQTEAVCIFPSDYVEVVQIPECDCSSCCLVNRKNDPLYVPELDPWSGKCTCNVPKDTVSYKFLIPFLLAMSLSVMQCGSVYVDMTREMA